MEELKVIKELQEKVNYQENILTLWGNYQELINKLCNKYSKLAEFDDLKQECFLLLCGAVKSFDVNKNIEFITYLYTAINRGLSSYINSNNALKIPGNTVALANKFKKYTKDFERDKGRVPTYQEKVVYIKYFMKQDTRLLETFEKVDTAQKAVSFETPLSDDGLTLGEILEDGTDFVTNVCRQVDHAKMSKSLYEAINNLDQDKRRVIFLYSMNGATAKEVETLTGIPHTRVCSLKDSAFWKLRHCKQTQELKNYVEVYLPTCSTRRTGLSRFKNTWTSATEFEAMRHYEQTREA